LNKNGEEGSMKMVKKVGLGVIALTVGLAMVLIGVA